MKKIVCIAGLALSLNGLAQNAEGKIYFPKGQKLEVTTETKKTATMEMMGQAMESTVNSTLTEVFDIEEVSGSETTIGHKVKRLVFSAEGMGNMQRFDSEKEEDRKGQMGKMMEKSLKNKYTMTVDHYGMVKAVQIERDSADRGKNAEQEQLAELASAQLGFKGGAPKAGDPSFFKILPVKTIKEGDTWMDSSFVNGQKRTAVYSVSRITGTDIILDYTETVNINSKQQIMGQEAAIKGDEKIVGQITLDKNTGLLKQKTATVDSSGSLEAQGMSIPSTGKSTITVTVKAS